MNIVPMPEDEEPRSKPTYSTPTKSAAKVLEEMVAKQASSTPSPSSSFSSRSRSSRATDKGSRSELPPLPPLPVQEQDPRTTSYRSGSAQPPQEHSPPEASFDSMGPGNASQPSIRSHPATTDTSHKLKHTSKSLPRRVLEELGDHRHRHSDLFTEATPTDSHAGRHRYAGSHSRSTSDSISVIMLMSKERLARETARANEAERRASEAERQTSEVMALFKSTHEAKATLERDLHKSREELGLYKVQLDAAQKEIFRAQETVDRVDRQRVNAEEELTRTKQKMRRLSETLAVEHALEEGRRAGFEEGLRQGRVYQQAQSVPWDETYDKSSKRRRSTQAENDNASEISAYTYPEERSSSGSSATSKEEHRSHRHKPAKQPQPAASTSTSRARPESTTTQSIYPQVSTYNPRPPRRESNAAAPSAPHTHSRPPDVAKYPAALPVRTVTTPAPVRAPSTQPPIPSPMPPHFVPEAIQIKPSDGAIHPILLRNTPSIKHESIILPPEGYIPVMNANSVIAMPPPHELAQPVAPVAPEVPPIARSAPKEQGSSTNGSSSARGTESRFRVINGDRPSRYKDTNDTESVAYTTRTGRDMERYGTATSTRSAASTQLSELDMLAPPRGREPERNRVRRELAPDQKRPTSPEQYKSRDTAGAQTTGRESRNQIERPRSAEPAAYSRPGSSAAMRPTPRAARRTREVVLPIPLGDPYDDPTTAHGHKAYPPRSATPANLTYGRPKLGSSDSSSRERPGSSTTVPEIDVETPTTTHQSVPSNRTTLVDPILLTPESANRPVALPDHYAEHSGLGIFTDQGGERIEARLPDDNLPPGFVPLSPIPGMDNLSPYPPGFAPSIPRNHPSGRMANFTYSSPLVRPVA